MSRRPFDFVLFGSLSLALRGKDTSRVLVELHERGVKLFNVRASKNATTLSLRLRDFGELYKACRRNQVKLRIQAREGLPFFLQKMRRRKMLTFGFGMFFVVIYVLSSMVWQVSISGVKDDTAQEVLEAAKESGVSVGSLRSSMDHVDVIADNILKKMPNLVWVGLQVSGAKVHIDALEEVPGVKKGQETPCNIVASKPAVIRNVFANRGEVLVKPGQLVLPGQLLISGNLAEGRRQVPADGKVLAEVWYTSRVALPLKVEQAGLTGASVQREYLSLGPLSLRVWGFRQPNYKYSLERQADSDWHIGNWVLPLQLKTVKMYEVNKVALTQSLTEAKSHAQALAIQDVRSKMHEDGAILGQTVLQQEVQNGKLYVTVLTETEEDIGIKAPL